jgi:hypothetical protein
MLTVSMGLWTTPGRVGWWVGGDIVNMTGSVVRKYRGLAGGCGVGADDCWTV